VITHIEEPEARRLVKSHRCAEPGCSGRLSVAWGGYWGLDRYILRCGVDAGHKAIKPNIWTRKGYHPEKGWIDVTSEGSSTLVKYETFLGPVELSVEAIRLYLCPKATPEEAFIFLQKCRFQKLNPFLGEAYLVVYDGQQGRSTSMIIGKEAHTRRAERHPDYLGMEAGLIIQLDGQLKEVSGAFLAPGAELLGGWCKVLRKGKEPSFISVSLKEYDKGRNLWRTMPATMIRKVAVVQALREAFPSDMAGLQGSGEFDLAEEERQVVEGQVVQKPGDFVRGSGLTDEELAAERRSDYPNAPYRDADDLFPGDAPVTPDAAIPWENDVEQLERTLDRDLALLLTPSDLFHACFDDFKLQPAEVLRIAGYSRAADLAGQNLEQVYFQVKATLRQ
jgi:phage recombination protein Bet